MNLLGQFFPGKEWHTSWTAWGVIVWGAVQAAEGSGLMPTGLSSSAVGLVEGLAQLAMVLGIRKAAAG